MKLVEQHIITKRHPFWATLDNASFKSKNLYNATLYEIRQHFFATGKTLSNQTLHQKMQTNPDFCALPRKVSQWVVKQVIADWWNIWKSLVAYKKNPEKFTGRPNLPHYKEKQKGRNLLIYTIQAIGKPALKEGIIHPSQLPIQIPTKQKNVNQVRIVPHHSHYTIEVVYTVSDEKPSPHTDRIASIDIGLTNLATVTTNQPDLCPLLVNGRPLKAFNQRYNKQKATLQAKLPKGQHTSRQINQLTFKRNQRVHDYLHRSSYGIVEYLKATQIGVLVIGKNDGWKQEINLGSVTNQNFVQIPHTIFIKMLTYKAELAGIKVILTEESYTSKCSFLDDEPIKKHKTYKGKRVHRGLFQAGDGRVINADVNGAMNIMRKVFPNVTADGIGASVVMPVRVTPFQPKKKQCHTVKQVACT
jgi:putative transposase